MTDYIVATVKPWNIEQFHEYKEQLPGSWHLITDRKMLTLESVRELSPRYIFFPHWSWIVPGTITENYECVCFHMTDLPYGRGGSPLQNLILNGHKTTMLSAFRMTAELDVGPIYKKVELSLEGSAQQIFNRMSKSCYELIEIIVKKELVPQEQQGTAVFFKRRTPAQSFIGADLSPAQLYDHIRMLDAEGYPHAFIIMNGYKLEFTDARINDETVTAKVTFKKKDK